MESENRKYTVLSFAVISGLTAWTLYLLLTQVADFLKMGGGNVFLGYSWTTVGGTLSGLIGFILFLCLALNEKASVFFDECFVELKKCTFPTVKETAQSTVVVSVMVGIAAILLFVMDYIWVMVFKYLFRVIT